MIRALLAAAAIGTLAGLALTFGPHGAIGIAVCAAGVIVWGCVRAVRRDGASSDHDSWDDPRYVKPADCDEDGYCVDCRSATVHKADCVCNNTAQSNIRNLKPWPIGDDEVRL